jgi:hypothetical protein
VANGARPGYAEPVVVRTPIEAVSIEKPERAWVVGFGYLDTNGNEVPATDASCSYGPQEFSACMKSKGITWTYSRVHPQERFWRFQFTEAGLFALLSAGLLGLGAWAAKRRLT